MENLPKIELHVHLDCCLSYDFVAKRRKISHEDFIKNFVAGDSCSSLTDHLSFVRNELELLQTEIDLRDAIIDLFDQFKSDNVIYAEIRFCPLLHSEKGLSPEEVVKILSDAIVECQELYNIEANLILATLREYSSEQSQLIYDLAKKNKHKKVVAIDLASDEIKYGIGNHIGIYKSAMLDNVNRIAHAGEVKGPESVWETINNLNPSRIGHGVKSIEDSELINYLIEKKIHLEVCPSSNLKSKIYPCLEEHPINELYKKGVSVGINTDGRTMTYTTLNNEYQNLINEFGWEKTDFLKCNINSISASFLENDKKEKYIEQLINSYK
jgi:adenosine deaminase